MSITGNEKADEDPKSVLHLPTNITP